MRDRESKVHQALISFDLNNVPTTNPDSFKHQGKKVSRFKLSTLLGSFKCCSSFPSQLILRGEKLTRHLFNRDVIFSENIRPILINLFPLSPQKSRVQDINLRFEAQQIQVRLNQLKPRGLIDLLSLEYPVLR